MRNRAMSASSADTLRWFRVTPSVSGRREPPSARKDAPLVGSFFKSMPTPTKVIGPDSSPGSGIARPIDGMESSTPGWMNRPDWLITGADGIDDDRLDSQRRVRSAHPRIGHGHLLVFLAWFILQGRRDPYPIKSSQARNQARDVTTGPIWLHPPRDTAIAGLPSPASSSLAAQHKREAPAAFKLFDTPTRGAVPRSVPVDKTTAGSCAPPPAYANLPLRSSWPFKACAIQIFPVRP